MPSQFAGEMGYSKKTAHELKSNFSDVTQRFYETNQSNIIKANNLRKIAEVHRKNKTKKQTQTKQNQIKQKKDSLLFWNRLNVA